MRDVNRYDDIVAEFQAKVIKEACLLIEAKIMTGFEVTFEFEGREYCLQLTPKREQI